MKLLSKNTLLFTICFLFSVLFISNAQASEVYFSDINDLHGADYFDSDNTTPDGNTLNIGLNGFSADEVSNFTYDTIAFTVTAAEGYLISSVSYYESGLSTGEGGTTIATGTLTIASLKSKGIAKSPCKGPLV